MTREELNTVCTNISTNKRKSIVLDYVKGRIEALRDAAILPTTKALYDEILELFNYNPIAR